MDLNLQGKTAYITGGGGAIGGAAGAMLAREGVAVALLDLDPDAATAKAEAIVAEGGKAVGLACDVTSRESVARSFEAAETAVGPADILVNNAGFSRDKYLTRMDEENWDIVHAVVLKGAFHCCRAVLPGMMERRWGRIVNISSMAYLGTGGQTNYSSAKAGLIGMTNALAREAGGFNITVNAVAPGLVATPRLKSRPDWDKLEVKSKALTPLPRLADEHDIAKAITFFTSSLADFVSAQCLNVSGGR